MVKRNLNKCFLVIIFTLTILLFATSIFLSQLICLKGDAIVYLALNEIYHEEGVSVKLSGLDDNIKISGKVNNTKVGDYTIKYETNVFGLKAKKYRTVKVVDEEAPEIELTGNSEVNLCPNSKYEEEGYTAVDNYDGDLTDKVTITENEDSITYSVSDNASNRTSVTRYLNRLDKEAPLLKLKGNLSYSIFVGGSFSDPGYEVTDNCDKNVKVVVSNKVDTSKVGTYEILYTATDESGNVTSVKRTIKVNAKGSSQSNTSKIPNTTGVIYLTFDDGPTESSTKKILEILDKKNVKATFFVINHSSNFDYLIKKEYDSGHTVALHSYTHDYKTVYSSKESYYNDLNKIGDKVEKIIGVRPKIIRFPGGGSNTVSRKYSKGIMSLLTKDVIEKGYRYFDWNVDSDDAGGAKNSSDVYKNVTSALKPNQANVVLMHDFANNKKTIEALEDIINYGLANGYKFDKIDVTTPMVRHHVNN